MVEHSGVGRSSLTDDQKADLMGIGRKHAMEQLAIAIEGDMDGVLDSITSEIREKRAAERWQIFKDDEHRKQLYFANRDSLISEGIECENRRPGFRPRAFWEYEAKFEASDLQNTELQHKYLIKKNLFFSGELDRLIEEWLQELETSKPDLREEYEDYQAGRRRPLLTCLDWPEEAKRLGKEAVLYGGKALKVWQEFLKEIEAESD